MKGLIKILSVVAATSLLWTTANAANLLSNGDFNAPNSTAAPTSWTTWSWGGGWSSHNSGSTLDGSYYMALGGASGSSGGGVYQVISGNPGVEYTLTVDSGAQAWWKAAAEMRLFFLDSASNILLQTNRATVFPSGYDQVWGWTNYSIVATSPVGTTQVKVEFAEPNGTGTAWFDNAVLSVPFSIPTISNVYPDGTTLLQSASALTFTAASTTTAINAAGIQLVLNGSNVSSGLVITGGPKSYNVSYPGLVANQSYGATITVTDINGFSVSLSEQFETYNPVVLWEAEDFDFSSGQYINNPTLSSSIQANSYFGQLGTASVDENELGGNPAGTGDGPEIYRAGDPTSTTVAGDVPRQNYLDAQAGDTNIQDYAVGYFYNGEWVNYTRNFPAGKYLVYARLATATAGSVGLDVVTSGKGTTSQTVSNVGSFKMPALGWGTYTNVVLTDASGNPSAVSLSGVTTLRVEAANAGGNMNYFFVVAANTAAPVISNVYPNGLLLFQQTNKFSFNVVSPNGYSINASSIHLNLNGSDVSSDLVVTGGASARVVTYSNLKSNTVYTAQITLADANGNVASATYSFDTYKPGFVWEAEDWDFSNGNFIDNPVLSSASQANSYFGQTGAQSIDENETGGILGSGDGSHLYRVADPEGTAQALDIPRQNFVNAQLVDANIQDYMLGWFNGGEWVNYTRTFPAGKYNVYVRAANGNAGTSSLYLGQVTSGRGTVAQATASVGSFTIPSKGWNTYSYVPCIDQFGSLAEVTLNGVGTFRLTGGSANVNFFMLVPARTDLPRITKVYPDGNTLLQGTNNFSFTVLAASNPVIPVDKANISLKLNGATVPLTFVASGANWNVTAPLTRNLVSNTAILNVADQASNTVTTTIYFDTFPANSFTWEAEDLDYSGGLFIDNPVPTSAPAANSYFGVTSSQGVDSDYVTIAAGSLFVYRPDDFIATDICSDTPLRSYVTARLNDPTIQDYNIGWWATNSWVNYTHTYPMGDFNVYARASGNTSTAYTIQLQTVSGGNGITLGAFSSTGRGYGNYDWVPLQSNGTNVTVTLGGLATLRAVTGGQANANRFLLVARTAPLVNVTISTLGANALLSFPTELSYNYTIEHKASLTDSWTTVATYVGDGTTQSHSVAISGASQFYRIKAQ